MIAVNLYFNVHLPVLLQQYAPQDIAVRHTYVHTAAMVHALNEAAEQCYLPANELMYDLIQQNKGQFAINFSISGIMLELMQQYRPDVLQSFQRLVDTGHADILAETYYHSLSFLYSGHAFRQQVAMHSRKTEEIFGITPAVFRNTELIYNNDLARVIASMGYKGILCEGIDKYLTGRNPARIYNPPGQDDFAVLLRNRSLSDDIAFRFDDSKWQEYPMKAEKFAGWLHASPPDTEVLNLFLHYETLGLHKPASTGIFSFFADLPSAVLAQPEFRFGMARDIAGSNTPGAIYDAPETSSWHDTGYGCSGNCTNSMQHNMLRKIYGLENMVMGSGNAQLQDIWGKLQAADHFYNMGNQDSPEGYNRFNNPFNSAEEAFANYTNILFDFEISLIQENISIARQKAMHHVPVYNLY